MDDDCQQHCQKFQETQPITIVEHTDSQILNVQLVNEPTEIPVADEVEPLEDTLKLDLFNQTTAAFMDEADDKEDEILNETGKISVRKAAIRQAESILSKNIGDALIGDKTAQTTALAHSIRNKRKMDSMYVLGKALSSRTKEWPDSQSKNEVANYYLDASPKPVVPSNSVNPHTPGK